MQRWELLVLSKLQWNVTAVTGFDYVDHVLERVPWTRRNTIVRRHAHTLVALCYTGNYSTQHTTWNKHHFVASSCLFVCEIIKIFLIVYPQKNQHCTFGESILDIKNIF